LPGSVLLARETSAKHVVVADAGHYLQLERAELVIASVQEVLQQVRLTSPMVSK
jgi:pimeloyl-ACP methyl ester carboxylesterase